MPNINGAIVMHTLQMIKTPATLREIVVVIAKNTELSQDDLMKPVKQTLDMGHRLGFLQKVNGIYFLIAITFDLLREEMKTQTLPKTESQNTQDTKQKPEKKVPREKKRSVGLHKAATVLGHVSTTTLIPNQPVFLKPEAMLQRKLKRSQMPLK
ncbi:hypothetical protein KR222_007510 [Zaprionus bogoriensis]|nr:hypothetical protein KR222_007510 [Zaprionus bogoriensis]